MRAHKYTILILIFLIGVYPLVAQTRVSAPKEAYGLPLKDNKFTTYDRHRETDSRGLRKSQFNGEHHAVGAFAYGGYSTSFASTSQIPFTPGGYDLRLGGVYEYSYGYFALQTGLGLAYRSIQVNLEDYSYTNMDLAKMGNKRWETVIDSWGMPIHTLTYQVHGRKDYLQRLAIQVPILVGVHVNGFYALGGFNFSLPIWGKSSTDMEITSKAKYARYYGEWEEMDTHGYRKSVPMGRGSNSVKSLFDVQVCGEIGYDWAISKEMHFRVAAYASYGLLNEARKASGKSLDIPYDSKWDFGTFGFQPIWYSDEAKGAQIHDFSAGVKITILYMFRQPDKCVLCGLRRK